MVGGVLNISSAGCSTLSVREAWLRNVIDDRREQFEATSHLSNATATVLARHGLLETAANDPSGASRVLETRFQAEPETDGALAMAELSFRAGLIWGSTSPQSAMAWYRDAAALAWLALADPKGSRSDLALRIHNRSVARLIRASQAEAGADGRNWRQVLAEQGISLRAPRPTWIRRGSLICG